MMWSSWNAGVPIFYEIVKSDWEGPEGSFRWDPEPVKVYHSKGGVTRFLNDLELRKIRGCSKPALTHEDGKELYGVVIRAGTEDDSIRWGFMGASLWMYLVAKDKRK